MRKYSLPLTTLICILLALVSFAESSSLAPQPTRTPGRTRTATRTPRPSSTPRPSLTPRPTRTPTLTPTPPHTLVPQGDLEPVSVDNASQFLELSLFISQEKDADLTSVVFSPDTTFVATGDGKGNITLWDVGKQSPVWTKKAPAPIYTLAFSPDGGALASAQWASTASQSKGKTSETVSLWSTEDGDKILDLSYFAQVRGLAFSPDGKQLATASGGTGQDADNTVRLWNAGTGKEAAVFKGHTNIVNSVAFSPDGSQLASGSTDGTLRLWDAKTPSRSTVLKYEFPLPEGDAPMYGSWSGSGTFQRNGQRGTFALSFTVSEDGKKILSYLLFDGRTIHLGGGPAIVDGAFTINISTTADRITITGKFVSQTSMEGTLKTRVVDAQWKAKPGTPALRSVIFSGDGQRLMTSVSNSRILLWDVATGNVETVLKGSEVNEEISSLALSPDGTVLVSAGRKLRLWDVEAGKSLFESQPLRRNAASAAFSPDARLVAFADRSRDLHLWGIRPAR
jgi:WD40 repeat protein